MAWKKLTFSMPRLLFMKISLKCMYHSLSSIGSWSPHDPLYFLQGNLHSAESLNINSQWTVMDSPCMIAAGQCVLNWAKNLQSVPSSMTTAIASAQLTLWQTGSHRESYNSFWNNPAFSIAWCPSNPTQWGTFWGRGSKKIIIFLKKMSLVIWVGFKGMCLSLKNYNLLTPSASKGSPLSTFIKFSDLISSYTIIPSYSTASYFQTLHSVLCCHVLFRFLFILCFILFLRG